VRVTVQRKASAGRIRYEDTSERAGTEISM
jgi:hypothetical protein